MVFDRDSELLKEFWRPGDIILNPFDKRSAYWTPWSEDTRDYKAFSEALTPFDAKYANFSLSAQIVLSALLAKTKSIAELALTSRMTTQEMELFLTGTEAQGVITEAFAKGADAVLGIVQVTFAVFNYKSEKAGEQQFSIQRWIADTDDRRNVFLTCPGDQSALLRPLITLWLDIAAREIIASGSRQTCLIADEFAALPVIPALESLLRGNHDCVLAVQDLSQIEAVYGKDCIVQQCELVEVAV